MADDFDTDLPAGPLAPLEKPFIDDRGVIRPLVDRLMRSAVLIESKAGAVRANHYHKTGWHYCYVLSGAIHYFHRPAGAAEPAEKLVIGAGQMVFTPPRVEHAMTFAEDTVFLTLDRNPRDQESYEADVVRIPPIQEG